jgi:peptide-methionine (S)-S-oxide reductase
MPAARSTLSVPCSLVPPALRTAIGALLIFWLPGCAQPGQPATTAAQTADAAATTSDADEARPPMPTTDPADAPRPADQSAAPAAAADRELATLGGGCFWCVEAALEALDGVLDVTSGYAGGTVADPTYKEVCGGDTGHAEVVQVAFDRRRISYAQILDWFFKAHDPTTLNRQGPDKGTQYRSVVFFHSKEQHEAALAAIARAQPRFASTIVTEVSAAPRFWPAEDYHQDYFRKNPNAGYCRAMIAPKLKKLGLEPKK